MIITFDVETIPTEVNPEWLAEQESAIREEYVKEDTIQKYLAKAKDSWRWEWGGSIPVAIAMVTDTGYEWSGCSTSPKDLIEEFFGRIQNLKSMGTGNIRLCGFNVLAFDIPVLHSAAAKYDIELPIKLDNGSLIDLSFYPYGKARDKGRKRLNDYLRGFGIESKIAHGSEVEQMWADDLKNKTESVRQYCLDDAQKEAMLLKKMQQFWRV